MLHFDVTAIVLDFDDTLVPLSRHLCAKRLLALGVSQEVQDEAYDKIRMSPLGYSPRTLIEVIAETHPLDNLEELIEICEKEALYEMKLFDEVEERVARWREKGIPVHILTYGNHDFQRKKVMASGLVYDELHIVLGDQTKKVKKLEELLDVFGGSICSINDKASEHDRVENDDVIKIWIRRPEVPDIRKGGKGEYATIQSLSEIDFDLVK